MKKVLFYFLKLAISIGLIIVLLFRIEYSELVAIFQSARISYLVIGFIFFIICWIVNTHKWQIVLAQLGIGSRLWDLFKLNLLSIFYAAVLPGGQVTGETIKCYKICQIQDQKSKLVFSVIMDRITGMIALVITGFLGILFSPTKIIGKGKILIFFSLLLVAVIIIFYVLTSDISIKIINYFHGIKQKISSEKIRLLLEKMIDFVSLFNGRQKSLGKAIFAGVIFQCLNFFSVFLLAQAVHLSINLLDLFWINAFVSFILVIPITILGLGLREGSFILLLGLLGAGRAQAISLSLLISLVYLSIGLLGGLLEFSGSLMKKSHYE